MDTVSTCI